ncbi:putative membrane protein (plasmid) [Phaeobacter piscinae]|nr:putative membrane protein [Phaeobacter piscinae]
MRGAFGALNSDMRTSYNERTFIHFGIIMTSTPATRLQGLDLARYFAFVGMVIVNFKIAMGAEGGTGVVAFLSTALEGRAAACFVVLAGIGLGLASNRSTGSIAATTVRRAAFLMGLGMINMLIFDADILHYYAVYFMFAAVLLRASTRVLASLTAILILMFPVLLLIFNYDSGWDWELYTYADLWTITGFLRHLLFNGWHPVVPWIAFLLAGIVLSRMPLQSRRFQIGLILVGAVIYTVTEATSAIAVQSLQQIDPELADLATTLPIPPMPFYMIAGLSSAAIVIGGCLLLTPTLQRLGIVQALAPAGRQTLTLYIAHILIGMGILEEMNMLEGQTPETAVAAALLFCICATGYAWLGSRFAKTGPIEMAMRKLAG